MDAKRHPNDPPRRIVGTASSQPSMRRSKAAKRALSDGITKRSTGKRLVGYLKRLTSWWLNHPFEKYARQIGSFPPSRDANKKYLSCHHLVLTVGTMGIHNLPQQFFGRLWGPILFLWLQTLTFIFFMGFFGDPKECTI